jgi:hypothetical protein
MNVAHIPFGYGAKGIDILPPSDKDKGYFERYLRGTPSIVPCTTYCPSCSDLLEYNKRSGQVKRKWSLNHGDLQFKLSYHQDHNGKLYAKCDACGFDLRKEPPNTIRERINNADEIIKSNRYKIKDYKYKNGNYYIPISEFISVAKKGKCGERVEMIIEQRIGPSINLLRLNEGALKNTKEFDIRGDVIGIPQSNWEVFK